MSDYLRTNYRVQSQQLIGGGIESALVYFSDFASLHGTLSVDTLPCTISMAGYGAPSWIAVIAMSTPQDNAELPFFIMPTQSFSGSIGWVYFYQSSDSFTVSIGCHILALIGSR